MLYKFSKFVLTLSILLVLFVLYDFVSHTSKKTPESTLVSNTPAPTPKVLNKNLLFKIINEWRKENGYREFIENEKLCDIAKIRLNDVKTNWSHDGFHDTITRYFGNINYTIGENLATSLYSEKETLDGWLDSSTHRKNLEYPYKYSCVATDGTYAVQIFGNF